jgi:maltose O-acetyltransferase
MTTWIDTSHCFLISIEDNSVFGENCAILAHDALAKPFIGAARLGRVRIREYSRIGMGTIIMPGVTIGPKSIIGAGSVVIRDIPEGVVAAGNPARVICSLDQFLEKQRSLLEELPTFPYSLYDIGNLTAERKQEMLEALETENGFMTSR